jgi:hypothetical protein
MKSRLRWSRRRRRRRRIGWSRWKVYSSGIQSNAMNDVDAGLEEEVSLLL